MLSRLVLTFFFFFFNDTATTEIYTLSLTTLFRSPTAPPPDLTSRRCVAKHAQRLWCSPARLLTQRSEEHTSELQSRLHLVCRLLLEKKKKIYNTIEAKLQRYTRAAALVTVHPVAA